MHRATLVFLVILVLVAAAMLVNCGSGSSNPATSMGSVTVSISDPPTCGPPQGPFSHIFVTVADVRIHRSADAGPNDSGWVGLTPSLKNGPKQIDLLGIANNQCFLAMLGSATEIQPGSYQQIRILLADNSVNVAGNQCGSAANCVMLTSDATNTPQPIQLSSETKTGIKIPSGQIAGGKLMVAAGETKDLNIDFNACASIVMQGNGQFRLKPVLHAGEAGLTSAAINGAVVDGATGSAVVGGTTVVALEQKDSSGVDRVIMETVTDSNGQFAFCPVLAGTYDLVVTAINGAGTAYAATVITGVQPGDALGTIPLTAAAAPASVTGQITSSTGSAAVAIDLSVSALQPVTVNGSNVLITTPLAQQSAATASLTTAPSGSCPPNTDCVSYTLSIPAANPSVGAFNTSGIQIPAPPPAGLVSYTIDAVAVVPGSAGTSDCNPSNLQTSQTNSNAALTVLPGSAVTATTLAFTGCQ